MRQIRGRLLGYFANWESAEFFSLTYADREHVFVLCDTDLCDSWETTELLQVPYPPCFCYCSSLAVRGLLELVSVG